VSFVADNDAKERVRQATDIAELIHAYVPLRRNGRNLVGLCWMHDDSRPSLQVNPHRQTWRCYVCNVGGDIFDFVQQYHKLNFREALEMLADRAGVILPRHQHQAPVQPGSPEDKKTLLQAVEWAEKQYHQCLLHAPEAEPARKYLEERRIQASSIERFRIGFAPDSWQWLLDRARNTNFSPAVLEACNLAIRKENSSHYYDCFRGRVMFPIHDLQGRAIAFGGRVLPGSTDARKYVNSTETRLFVKSDNLYALSLASQEIRATKSIVVMEGYTDVVIAHQSGVKNAVAVLGTALNPQHVRIMRRFADTVYLVLDGDDAGQRRTNEVLEHFLTENVDLRIVTLPDELDPAEFLLERSADEFRSLMASAVDAIEHRIRTATRGVDLLRDTHRANQALEQILSTVAKVQPLRDGLPSALALREQQLLARLARTFNVPEELIRQRMRELRAANASRATSRLAAAAMANPASAVPMSAAMPMQQSSSLGTRDAGGDVQTLPAGVVPLAPRAALAPAAPLAPAGPMSPRDRELLEIMLAHPDLVSVATANIDTCDLVSGDARTIFDVYVMLIAEGESPRFERVLESLSDPRLHAVLVQLDEQAHEKLPLALQPADVRLRRLINDFRGTLEEQERRAKVNQLNDRQSTPEQELELLKDLLNDELRKRGLKTTTEG
jgi:DNA primase